MLRFDMRDPYPLLEPHQFTLAEAKQHSVQTDRWLGLRVSEVEAGLIAHGCRQKASAPSHQKQNLWIGLAAQNLLTPYVELRRVLEDLKPAPGSTVVDLGAGYGRLGFVMGRHFRQVNFVGYEYVGERVGEARRCLASLKYPNVRIEHQDLLSPNFKLPKAEYYFIYDYGSPKAVEKTLFDLRRIAAHRAIYVIGRGRARETIGWRHSWLKPQTDEGYCCIYGSEI